MSAVLTDELKNPLASLKGHAQLLAELLEGQPQAPRADTVVIEAQRIEPLIEDLLAFARKGRLDLVSTDPAALVRDVAEHGVFFAVSVRLDHPPATWRLDPARLRQGLVWLWRSAWCSYMGAA